MCNATRSDHRVNIHDHAQGVADWLNALIRLGQCDTFDDVPAEVMEELDITPEVYDDPRDAQADAINSGVYSLQVFRPVDAGGEVDADATPIIWALTGGGGPTTHICIDQWDEITAHHSWGKDGDAADAADLHAVRVYGVNVEDARALFVIE